MFCGLFRSVIAWILRLRVGSFQLGEIVVLICTSRVRVSEGRVLGLSLVLRVNGGRKERGLS